LSRTTESNGEPVLFAVMYGYGASYVLAKGKIAIPKSVRDALSLREATKPRIDVRGQELVLRKSRSGEN
jgi:AbrB family looped-hinge helix DNA binding protein